MAQTAPHDIYGFPLLYKSSQQAAQYDKARSLYQTQKKAWQKYASEKRLPSSRSKLKKLVRGGIPPNLRPWLWFEVSHAKQLKQAQAGTSYYTNLVKAASLSKATVQVELDLPRTFPSHPYLSCEIGQAAMRRILTTYSLHNPRVGYCQGLNFIVGIVLLAMEREEESTFWLLAALVETICYQGSFGHNLSGCHVEMKTLESLIASKLPKLGAHFAAMGCETSIFAVDWFLTLYCVSLPAESVCRVLDALLYEGAKVLFRVALALLKVAEPALLKLDNAGETVRVLKDFLAGLYNIDPLIGIGFKGIGSLSLSKVDAVRQAKSREVQAFMEQRRQQRAAQQLASGT